MLFCFLGVEIQKPMETMILKMYIPQAPRNIQALVHNPGISSCQYYKVFLVHRSQANRSYKAVALHLLYRSHARKGQHHV